MKVYVLSQFGYCPLAWMFHSRGRNDKTNFLHERALRITYGDSSSSFQDLLKKTQCLSIIGIYRLYGMKCSKLKIILHRKL